MEIAPCFCNLIYILSEIIQNFLYAKPAAMFKLASSKIENSMLCCWLFLFNYKLC